MKWNLAQGGVSASAAWRKEGKGGMPPGRPPSGAGPGSVSDRTGPEADSPGKQVQESHAGAAHTVWLVLGAARTQHPGAVRSWLPQIR